MSHRITHTHHVATLHNMPHRVTPCHITLLHVLSYHITCQHNMITPHYNVVVHVMQLVVIHTHTHTQKYM